MIGSNVKIDYGTIIGPNCVIEADVTIDSFVTINALSFVGHESKLANFVTLSPRTTLLGGVQIKDRAFLDASSTVNVKTTVGEDAFVCMGTTVISEVAPCTKVSGIYRSINGK